MTPEFIVGSALLFLAAFGVGIRETWRMWRRYRTTMPLLAEPEAYLLLWALTVTCLVVTGSAGFFGILALRHLLGFGGEHYVPLLSLVVASAVLFIPLFLGWVADRISEGDGGTDG